MENMEINDIINTEAIEEMAEAAANDKSGLKTVAKVGVIGAFSIAAWEFAIKPLGRKAKNLIVKKAAKKLKKTEANEEDLYDMDLGEIPEIDE